MWFRLVPCLSAALFAVLFTTIGGQDAEGVYKVGVGIGDITGPPGGVGLNGYINPFVYAAGIHTRQFARAFVVQSLDSNNTVVYVTCDMGMIDHSMKAEVVSRLQSRYGTKYSTKNILLSATHTYSGVSGFMTYFSYILIESQGFNPLAFWAAVDGIVDAIETATESMADGRLFWNKGDVEGGNANRRRESYLMNPPEERAAYDSDVDREMVILKIETVDGEPIGIFTWWPVHPTSFNDGNNPLISSDSKGYASILFDQRMNPGERPGQGAKFVAGFGSSNLGDVIPVHEEEDADNMEKTRQLGLKQFDKAWELFNDQDNLQPVIGPVRFAHQFVDSETVQVEILNEAGLKETLQLCKAALGFSYVGIDPGDDGFWESIRDLIKEPSDAMIQCQAPKIVALAAGEMDQPWEWSPRTFPLQILQIGSFDITAVPGEYTTMSGRRVRNAVYNVTGHQGVIAGLANNYINYIATPEEYDVQGSEAGATIYGRNTLPVTVALFKQMAEALMKDEQDTIEEGTPNPSFLEHLRDRIDPQVDQLPLDGSPFGTLITQPLESYTIGEEMEAIFSGASARHSPMRRGAFLLIEKENQTNGEWEVVKTDADLDTTFWYNVLMRRVVIKWYIGVDTVPGTYRVRHFGYFVRNEDQGPRPYYGTTSTFRVEL